MPILPTVIALEGAPIFIFTVGGIFGLLVASFELPKGTMLGPMSVLLALVTFAVEVRDVRMDA